MDQPDLSGRHTRRAAARLLAGGALALAAGLARRPQRAEAARAWCRAEPVLRIAGQLVHVYIASYVEMLEAATDKIRLTVTVPVGVRARLEDIPADFGEGYDLRFAESKTLQVSNGRVPVLLAVYCPATDSTLPVVVDFAPEGTGPLTPAGASGFANAWITFRAG